MDIKIKLTYYDLEDNIAVESVWATKEREYYRIKNAPFYAPNLAYDDLISAEKDDDELHFDELIKASGNSTVQIIIYDKDGIDDTTKKIEQLNCNWEGSNLETYISVDVPHNINYNLVRKFLIDGRQTGKFDFQEACLSEEHNLNIE